MVRVCSNKKCPRPHHVFGCVFYTGKIINCDDCRYKKPEIYEQCSVRKIEPSPEDSASGLCCSCAQTIFKSMKPSYRRKSIIRHDPAAPFSIAMP